MRTRIKYLSVIFIYDFITVIKSNIYLSVDDFQLKYTGC